MTRRLLDMVPVEERFALARAFITTACGFPESPDVVVTRLEMGLAWDNFWADDAKQSAWLTLLHDNPMKARDLAGRVIDWLANPCDVERHQLIDDLRVR